MHPVAVHWAKKSNCSAEEWYSASFRLSAYNDSCTALTHNWESLLLNTYKQHIAHFMMWEQEKYWAVLWLIQKHVGIRRNQSLNRFCMTKDLCSMQKVQSPMDSKCLYFSWPREVTTIQTWVWQKFGTKFSDHYLDNSSGQEKKTQGTWSNWAKQSHGQPDTNLRGFRRKAWRRIPGYHTVASIPMDN